MNKTDFFTMLYQFIAAGIIFFFSFQESLADPLTAHIIYPFEFIGINLGFTSGLFIINIILFLGMLGLVFQRKLYVNQQIKKAIEPYKIRKI